MTSAHDPARSHERINDVDGDDEHATLNMSSHKLAAEAASENTIVARAYDHSTDVGAGAASEKNKIMARAYDHSTSIGAKHKDKTVELSPCQDLVVKLKNSNVKIMINHDDLGLRIFNSGTSNPAPMVIQRPDSYDVFLFKHRYSNTFNFFGLPGEIRNLIYGFLFQQEPEPREQSRCHFFKYKKAQNPVRFFTHLNRKATGKSGLPLANRQTLHETIPFFLESRYFEFYNDNSLRIFLKSIGPHGRSVWSGPLRIFCFRDDFIDPHWQGNGRYKSDESWTGLLAECRYLRAIRIRVDDERSVSNGRAVFQGINTEPFHLLMARCHGQFPRLDSVTMMYLWQNKLDDWLLPWLFATESGKLLGSDLCSLFKSNIAGAALAQRLARLRIRTNDWLKIPRP